MAMCFRAALCLSLVGRITATPSSDPTPEPTSVLSPPPNTSTLAGSTGCVDVGKNSTGIERECFHRVKWAKYVDMIQHPDYFSNYSDLSKYSSFTDFQCALWHMGFTNVPQQANAGHVCPKPCTTTMVQCGGHAPTPSPGGAPDCTDVGKSSTGLQHECFHFVKQAKYRDIVQHPERFSDYGGLSTNSSLADFQCALWDLKSEDAHCPKPCTSILVQCMAEGPTPQFPLWAFFLLVVPCCFAFCTSAAHYFLVLMKEGEAVPQAKKRSGAVSTRAAEVDVVHEQVPSAASSPQASPPAYVLISRPVPVPKYTAPPQYSYVLASTVPASPQFVVPTIPTSVIANYPQTVAFVPLPPSATQAPGQP